MGDNMRKNIVISQGWNPTQNKPTGIWHVHKNTQPSKSSGFTLKRLGEFKSKDEATIFANNFGKRKK